MFSADKPLTDAERALIMRDIKIDRDNFVQRVAEYRRQPVEKIDALADGSSMLGEQALENGLIDRLGGTEEALAYLEQAIGEPPCALLLTRRNSRTYLSEREVGLALLVLALRPEFESVALEARDDVHVRVLHDLPRMRAIVHVDIDAVGADRALDCPRKRVHRARDRRPILRRNIKNIFEWSFGMTSVWLSVHGTDVEKSERPLVLVDFVRGKFPAHYFAKDAIRTHVCSIWYFVSCIHTAYDIRNTRYNAVMEISELVRTLLAKRGVESANDITAFLNPDYELHTHDPFLPGRDGRGRDTAPACHCTE